VENLRKNIIFVFLFFLTSTLYSQNLKNTHINIVDDGAQWPPFIYYERKNGKISQNIVGFSIDVINEIFKRNNITYSTKLLPWKRALKELELGVDYQLILNASYSKKRDKLYYFTRPFYSLNNFVFYSKEHYPQGLESTNISYIKNNYKVCGLLAYNYTDIGFKDEEIDKVGFYDFDKLIRAIEQRQARCNVFLEGYEIFVGFQALGKDYFSNKNLGYAKIKDAKQTPFHMIISKKFKYANELTKLINEGLNTLEESGRLEELKTKYNLNY